MNLSSLVANFFLFLFIVSFKLIIYIIIQIANAINIGLRNKIANITKGETIIGRQSDTELKIIMKGIYLLYGKNLDDNVVEQTRELNKKVLDYAVRRIMTEIEQYNNYVKDASSMHVPLDRSENVSNKGSKTL